MNFLVDRRRGSGATEWLESQVHDPLDDRELGPDL